MLLPEGIVDDSHLYDVSVPIAPFDLSAAKKHVVSEDVVITGETKLLAFLSVTSTMHCRKAVFNKNGFYALSDWPGKTYAQLGFEFALSSSNYNLALTSEILGLPSEQCFLVTNDINRPPFGSPGKSPFERVLSVSYMPRKLPRDAVRIRRAVKVLFPKLPFVPIHNSTEKEVAKLFRQHPIFLSTQEREGFGNPAIEAMSCGTIVVGYPGTHPFTPPYANSTNGYWARDRQWLPATMQLIKAIRDWKAKSQRMSKIYVAGIVTAENYDETHMTESLREVVKTVTACSYSSRNISSFPRLTSAEREFAQTSLDKATAKLRKSR
ncbi:glycosyltransferase [Lamprobacter modestohalophilus]|uniref:glycosyltransferase n=1 Tax=Lamprobacter modestohalophilus TaxID=1064514 RepID=UPI002ADEF999|nr:glycosyltransferase [Lamprobacter modestohalophilus]MEA1050969.1 glycosyltransferase [Lamprobacter modestohalophilus]